MNQQVMFSSNRNDWETPQAFFEELNEEFHFTLDACSTDENAKCAKHYTEADDGLLQDWGGETVFCNPPYSGSGRQDAWVKKAYEESRKLNTTVVLLIPARTDTARFHDYVFGKASEIRFLRGRLKFEIGGKAVADDKGNPMGAPFPSAVVIYGQRR